MVVLVMVVMIVAMVVVIMIVMMLAGVVAIVIGEKMRIEFGDAVELERAEVKDRVQRDVAAGHAMDAGSGVHAVQRAFDLCKFVLADEVSLVEQDNVGERDLLGRFFAGLQLLQHMLGVDHGDDRIELGLGAHVCVNEESLRHRRRAG